MAKIIGIDLGTTNSVVAIMEGDQPKVLINSQGSRLTPSVVAFTEKGERLVGQVAKHQQVTNPKNTVFSIKRFMGRRHSEVAQEEKMVPYEIVGGAEEMVKVKVRGKDYTPEQISAFILQDLKKTAEAYLGDKVTDALINYLAEEFRKQEGIDLRKDAMALQRLKEAAEKAKIELSNAMETTVNLPFITADQNGPKHLQFTLTRTKFEQLIGALVEKCRQPVQNALKDAGLQPNQIDEVILVGGATRVPMVQRLVKELYAGKEPNKTVNPDEVVAVGAAIQGAIATGAVKDILVLDATPLSLGVETLGGVMTVLIPRNTTIPTSKNETFSTAADNQSAVTINVLQGEREFARDNRLLGTFNLEGIPPAPRGVPQIEVTFNVDVNGILTVAAKDKGTGKENKITVQNAGGLSKEEIEKMKADAESHAAEDKKRREVIDLKNQGEAAAYNTERQLKEHGDKVSAEVRGNIESALNNLRDALKSDDGDRIKKTLENLQQAAFKLGEEIYKTTGTAPGAAPGGAGVAPEAQTDRGATAGAGAKKDEDV